MIFTKCASKIMLCSCRKKLQIVPFPCSYNLLLFSLYLHLNMIFRLCGAFDKIASAVKSLKFFKSFLQNLALELIKIRAALPASRGKGFTIPK